MQLSFVTLDVFTTTRYLGNPLAVVQIPSGQDVSTEQMQTIAREFNLSETIFIHEQSKADNGVPEWRVRIFVTTAEIPFAGHPTIGASCYTLGTLAKGSSKGRLICNAGPIEIEYNNGLAKASIPHNVHVHTQHPVTNEQVWSMHSRLKEAGVEPKSAAVVSPVKGMNFICIELPDLKALGVVEVSGVKPKATLDDDWNAGLLGSFPYVITDLPKDADGVVKVRTRMMEGSMEDPATGSASCGLTAYLAMKLKLGRTTRFELTQGVEMGRKSDIGVVITLNEAMDKVERMELSGSAVKVMEGTIEA
jgi:PhzF family phenazine biosynthesis protein